MKPILMLLAATPLFAATSGVVHIEYYYNPGCGHCGDAITDVMAVVEQYAPMVELHKHVLQAGPEWIEFMAREQLLGYVDRGPQAVYIGPTALYMHAEIAAGLENLVTQGIAAGGVPRVVIRPDQLELTALAATGRTKSVTWADRRQAAGVPSLSRLAVTSMPVRTAGVRRGAPLRLVGVLVGAGVLVVLMVLAIKRK